MEKTVQTESKGTEIQNESKDNEGTSAESENNGEENSSNSKDMIFIDVKSMDETSTFPFGISRDNVVIKLKELKLAVKNEIEITTKEDDPQFGNKELWADGIIFSFDKNNKLYSLSLNEEIPTSLGLKKGDSLEKAESLYGKNYIMHKTDIALVYEYTFVDHYFRVFVEDGKITEWVVSKYSISRSSSTTTSVRNTKCRMYFFNRSELKHYYVDKILPIENGALASALTKELQSTSYNKDFLPLTDKIKIKSAKLDKTTGVLSIVFSDDYLDHMTLGTTTEGALLTSLLCTYGYNLGVDKISIYFNHNLYTGLGDLPQGYFTVEYPVAQLYNP